MPRKHSAKLQTPLPLQSAASLFPTISSASGRNVLPLLQLDRPPRVSSVPKPPPSCGRGSPPKKPSAPSPRKFLPPAGWGSPQTNTKKVPGAAAVGAMLYSVSFPKLFPFDQGNWALGDQSKLDRKPRLAVEEPQSVTKASERNADNQMPPVDKEAEPGPSKMVTAKRRVAVSPGDVCRFQKKLHRMMELPSHTAVTLSNNSDEDFDEPPRTPPLFVEPENIVQMLADSSSFSPGLKSRCGAEGSTSSCLLIKDYIPSQSTPGQEGAKVPDWEESSSQLEGEEFLPWDTDFNRSGPDTSITSSLASVANDWSPNGLALEYLLTPLTHFKKYSSQNFNQQVENYFKRVEES